MAKEQAQTTDIVGGDNPKGDFMLDTLDKFNKGAQEGSPDESQADVEVAEEQSANSETQMTEAEARTWLIENKFPDNEEGRAKLAESYKKLQSEKDKMSNDYQGKEEKYKQLDSLDTFLRDNPEVVSKMRDEIQKVSNATTPPEKPEDYDPYEENVPGSSSQQWREAQDQYLIKMGSEGAKQELDKFRQELSAEKATQAEIDTLHNLGLNDAEIQEYRDFINDPNVVTPENLVNIWRHMSGNRNNETASTNPKSSSSQGSTGRTSIASVSEVTPSPKKSSDKQKDEFFDGLMQFSNNYSNLKGK